MVAHNRKEQGIEVLDLTHRSSRPNEIRRRLPQETRPTLTQTRRVRRRSSQPPPAWEWLQKKVLGNRIPVIDHMWQTETSGPLVGNPTGIALLPIKPGSAAIPLPGVDAEIVDDE